MKNIAAGIIGLVVTAVHPVWTGDSGFSPALRSMTDTERSFAKRCGEVGVRASFLEYFADDAIAFTPEPVRYKEAVKGLPPPADPLAIRLEWEPQAGDISASEDLGYTTGPSVRTNAASPDGPKRFGQFLSVWKKEGDGIWRVVVDIGVRTPEQTSSFGMPFTRVQPPGIQGTGPSGGGRNPVKLDEELSRLCTLKGVPAGYRAVSGEVVRLHREGHMPLVGTKAVQSYLTDHVGRMSWLPMAGGISHAGDLCYTYGSYELKAGLRVEGGYYLHIWKRSREGKWELVADATNPKEPDEPK